mmetsp:Transcript_33307/g.71143  ORF Transcript_33307/g.71143 Transcript_33307/m.71143 type:complete len:226 (-) Transcript_33307:676-1353(-)
MPYMCTRACKGGARRCIFACAGARAYARAGPGALHMSRERSHCLKTPRPAARRALHSHPHLLSCEGRNSTCASKWRTRHQDGWWLHHRPSAVPLTLEHGHSQPISRSIHQARGASRASTRYAPVRMDGGQPRPGPAAQSCIMSKSSPSTGMSAAPSIGTGKPPSAETHSAAAASSATCCTCSSVCFMPACSVSFVCERSSSRKSPPSATLFSCAGDLTSCTRRRR